jgi:NitT/TauT family transport system permease protein
MAVLLRIGRGAALPLLILLCWEAASRAGLVSRIVAPPPSAVLWRIAEAVMPAGAPAANAGPWATVAWAFSGELARDTLSSLMRVAGGFLLGAALALPLGMLMGAWRQIYGLLNPLLQILRPIPPIAYIPLAIIWFGVGNPPAFFLIALGAFFPILINTIAGVRNVDGIYIRAAQNLGAGQATLFFRIILPAALPYIFTGVRIGIGTAFLVVIVAEMLAVPDGLGFRIMEAREFMRSDKVIAGMVTIGLLGLLIDLAVSSLHNRLLSWHRGLDH